MRKVDVIDAIVANRSRRGLAQVSQALETRHVGTGACEAEASFRLLNIEVNRRRFLQNSVGDIA